ncbi:hypothetical protein KC340_g86 [Hortaea werneckii]|nr:hypothetical protein KC340_g86 [Hortaea werneckii]
MEKEPGKRDEEREEEAGTVAPSSSNGSVSCLQIALWSEWESTRDRVLAPPLINPSVAYYVLPVAVASPKEPEGVIQHPEKAYLQPWVMQKHLSICFNLPAAPGVHVMVN